MSDSPPRRPVLQPALVRIYKIAGILTLVAILVGLVAFVTVNVVYFFNRSWVRPVILSTEHPKVIEAARQMADARARALALDGERVEAQTKGQELDRLISSDDKFLADVAGLARGPIKTTDDAVLRRQIDQVTIERADALDRKAALARRLAELDQRSEEQRRLIERLSASPYLRAADQPVTIAFVPYQNLSNVGPGTTLYGCAWHLVGCRRVGIIVRLLEGEVQDVHPHDDSSQRGVMIEIELRSRSAAEERVLFAGGKPLWIL
ncbi:MAG: hypothetical protein KBG28_19880 [Kofleriaceae bacterium]|jgi:hypothetical protein|nr:hypothetical protein [Kofleriaceae bacterium]MBP6841150.1 hypothetical protein [Kofleriaceae bacterium]MBP9206242.1 hypothetical protein [Kofleriaceae bacterium]